MQEMRFKLKALGLSLVAAFAMSAVAASAASAVGIHGEAATTHLTGSVATGSSLTLDLANGTPTNCTTATIADGVTISTVTQEEIVVSPTFSGCKTLGQNTKVLTNGCKFTFKVTSTTAGTAALVECPKPLEVQVFKSGEVLECTVLINSQVPTNPAVDYAAGEKSGKKDITVTSTATGITYTTSPATGTVCGEKSALGKQTGKVTVFGFSDAAHEVATGITIA
jgi:hypothetical protein